MNEKVKSFYNWYFKDNIVIPYPKLDEGSKRLGKLLCTSGGIGWVIFVMVALIEHPTLPPLFHIPLYFLLGLIFAWIGFRIIRGSFWAVIWIIDWVGKAKE